MSPRPIIIDTDPGQDDAAALLLAMASPELELLGICTVAGNVPLDKTTRNALQIMELAVRPDIRVHPGCPRPILRPLVTAEHAHGQSGLDGSGLPDPVLEPHHREHAVEFLIRTLRETDEPVTVVAIGPLTNIACALIQAPEIIPGIKELVLMGGSSKGGNITPAAEFNIHVDPHAAQVVFNTTLPIVMMPLDVTQQARTTPERLERVRGLDTPVGRAMAGMLGFYNRENVERHGGPGSPLHDPLTIAWLLQPSMFQGNPCHVTIECGSELTMGQTVIDWWGISGKAPNATVMHTVDDDAFYDLFIKRLESFGGGRD